MSEIEFGTKVYGVNSDLKLYEGVIVYVDNNKDNGFKYTLTQDKVALTPRQAYEMYRKELEKVLANYTKDYQKLINKCIKLERSYDNG